MITQQKLILTSKKGSLTKIYNFFILSSTRIYIEANDRLLRQKSDWNMNQKLEIINSHSQSIHSLAQSFKLMLSRQFFNFVL
jgi:hypothetical protein